MRTRNLVLAAATGAVVAAPVVAARRWQANQDPTEGMALADTEGDPLEVTADDGTVLRGVVAGEGPDVVLLHGYTNSRQVWGAVAQRLVDKGHRVIAYDHRGHGESDEGPGDFSLPRLASDLGAVLDHVDARHAVLAGHSMGGMTAQTLVITEPGRTEEQVGALVLVATACHGVGRSPWLDRVAKWVVSGKVAAAVMARPAIGTFAVRRIVGKRASLAHLEAQCQTFTTTAVAARRGCLAGMHEMDLRDRLGEITIPVTIVSGQIDRLLPFSPGDVLARGIPHSRHEVLHGMGHMLHWEDPDTVARLIADTVPVLHR